MFVQSDGNYAAHVKVPSLQDAQYAISQLHRRKVGYKRILISYANSGGPSPQLIRYGRNQIHGTRSLLRFKVFTVRMMVMIWALAPFKLCLYLQPVSPQ